MLSFSNVFHFGALSTKYTSNLFLDKCYIAAKSNVSVKNSQLLITVSVTWSFKQTLKRPQMLNLNILITHNISI